MRAVRRAAALIAISAMAVSSCSNSPDRKPAATTTATIRIVNQNLLHGTACPADSNRCDLPHRVALFSRQLVRGECPELVAIEEANRQTVQALRRHLPGPCGYRLAWDGDPGQDREVVLSTLPILRVERRPLAGPLRTALSVQVAAPVGAVDLVATHLASSSDDRPCDASTCPPPCRAADTLNACQGRQAVAFLHEERRSGSVAILAGDLNATPGEPTIMAITAAGMVDTFLAARNPECNPTTGNNCTSGRIDDSLIDMKSATSKQTERIDDVFLRPIRRCTIVRPTGVFASNGGPVGKDAIVFPADHAAVIATISCRTSSSDRAMARSVASTTTTTTTAEGPVSSTDRAAITAAFTNLFAPNPDPDVQLSTLEHGDALRESFIARKQQVGDLATKTSVRIESFDGQTGDVVRLTFSILLDGNVVLDHLPGQAKLVGARWFVATQSYCQVATLGMPTIPEPCR